MQDSIFTKIIKGQVPCYKIYEDDQVIAFLDVHPLATGHTLVVPKKQVDHLWDLDDATYQHLWSVVKKLGVHLKTKFNSARTGVIVEGFGVPHVHVHLIPINNSHELKQVQDYETSPPAEQLTAIAEQLQFND